MPLPRQRTRALLLGTALGLTLGASVSRAHDGHTFSNPFHDVSVEDACALAAQEYKLVFVYVTKPGEAAPAYLERPSWRAWRAIDPLIREMVAVKVDGTAAARELPHCTLRADRLPVMLVLDHDGTERHRSSGAASVEQLTHNLSSWLQDASAVERARKAAAQADERNPMGKERLAAALARSGNIDAALDAYRWCIEVGCVKNSIYGAARRRFIFKSLHALAEEHPAAGEMLLRLQREMEATLLGKADDPNIARNFAELNLCLKQTDRSLALYDRLPERSRARQILFDRVLDQLVAARRYAEVLDSADAESVFRQEVLLARGRRFLCAETPDMRNERGTRVFAIARGSLMVECLAGVGRTEKARRLAERVLRYQNDAATRRLLRNHLQRVKAESLLSLVAPPAAGDDPSPAGKAPKGDR